MLYFRRPITKVSIEVHGTGAMVTTVLGIFNFSFAVIVISLSIDIAKKTYLIACQVGLVLSVISLFPSGG